LRRIECNDPSFSLFGYTKAGSKPSLRAGLGAVVAIFFG
jgi:hypothetical protein